MPEMNRNHDRFEPHIAEIRKSGSTAVRVTLNDGTAKVLALPKGRNKWSDLEKILERLPWDTLEGLDAKSQTLCLIESEGEPDEEDFEDAPAQGSDAKTAKVMFALMKATMAECRKMFEVNLNGMAKVVNTLAESVSSLQQVHEVQMRVQMAAMASAGGGDNEVMEMMKMALPMLAMNRPQQQQMRLPHVPRRPNIPPKPPKPPEPAPENPVASEVYDGK